MPPSTLAQSKERKGSNFAIRQPCRYIPLFTVKAADGSSPLSLLNAMLDSKAKVKIDSGFLAKLLDREVFNSPVSHLNLHLSISICRNC